MVFHSVPIAFLMPQGSCVAWRVAVGARVLWHSGPLPPPCRTSDRIFQCERYCFPIRGRHRIPCHRGRLYPSFWGVLHPPRGGALYPFYQRDNLSLAWGCCVPPRGCRTHFCKGIFYPLGGIASLSTRGLCTPLDMGCTAPALGLGCCIPFLHGDVRGYFAQFPQGYGIPLAWGACCTPPQGPLGA